MIVLRLAVFVVALVVGAVGGAVLVNLLFPPPPAAVRLAGVTVEVVGFTIDQPAPAASNRHRLELTLAVSSARALDACLAFTIDVPFAGRRLDPASSGCIRPIAGRQVVTVASDRLIDDDLTFPSHTLVWGVQGGRCGLVLEAFGVCVVEQAGTAPLQLPETNPLPSLLPLGSFTTLFSFPPP